ncbi:MAG TPA: prolyl oligopeptidase family serine peptidase [Chryseosolibacter sp.]
MLRNIHPHRQMKLLLLFLVFCAYAASSQDLSMFERKEYTSPNGGTLLYRILYPEHYDRGKKYPLVLFLHGAGERGSDNEKQLIHGSKQFVEPKVRKKYPAIVVFPQCPEEDFWASVKFDRNGSPFQFDFDYSRPLNASLVLAIDLVKTLVGNGSVDARRVYITGLSMGGMGTFEAVYHNPGLFAAAMPICGGGDTLRYEKVKTPFWIFHGDADQVVDVKYSRAMVARLRQLKVKVKYTEYPGVNHNSWDSAFAEPKFLRWMFRKRKGK